MKVLVISRNAWDITNSIGNTLSNFFAGVENIEFANIYFRSSAPDNDDCQLYYRVTEKDIIRNWFSPDKLGKKFVWNKNQRKSDSQNIEKKEKRLIRFIQKNDLKLAYRLSDFLWYSKKWINSNLKDFVNEFNPDVVFTFVKSAPQYYLTVKYLKENFNVPVFSWIADDEYTALKSKNKAEEISHLKYILESSRKVTGCSEEICDYYNSIFGCEATPLYKGCDLSAPVKSTVNSPLRVVFAGNLLYGRFDIIKRISDAIEKVDGGKKNILFEICSNTLLSDEEQKVFQNNACTEYLGKQSYDRVVKRLAEADIVLHVESFDAEQIIKTKYSFSTKIIDCLQSGNVMLAVGPNDVASVRYVKRIPGAYTIDDLSNLEDSLKVILDDARNYPERAAQIREFALERHDSNVNSKEIKNILEKIVEGEKN